MSDRKPATPKPHDGSVTKSIDPGLQLIVANVVALVAFHSERQRDAGRGVVEIAQDRARLVGAIADALGVANHARSQS